MDISVYVDFDGTITFEDTTDAVLERFADEAWHDIERDWVTGRIGSRECLARQIDLVRATPDEIDDFARNAEYDQTFPAFVAFCQKHDIPLAVVSDGFDRIARLVLERAGVENVPIMSNELEWMGGDRWRLGFPHSRGDCKTSAGNCKCAKVAEDKKAISVLIGDGRSDICASGIADVVLARDSLAVHCRTSNRTFASFTDFSSIIPLFEGLLEIHPTVSQTSSANEVPAYEQRA